MLLAFVETPQRHRRLSVFPIVAADEPQLSYVLVLDALRQGVLSIEEAQGDRPPHLIARNRAPDPVLILDGETLGILGENHSTHQSVLLGPDSVTRLPVSCNFTGKWSCEERERKLTRSLDSFPLLEGQVGILAFLGRHLLGLDALGSPHLYAPLHRRLLTGYLISAMSAKKGAGSEPQAEDTEVMALAMALESAERVAAPCHGHGEYAVLRGEVTGGELRHNGHLVHLSVFPNGVAA